MTGSSGREHGGLAVRGARRRAVAAELIGVAAALGISLIVVAHLVDRQAWLLFADGDSLVTVLLAKSFALGGPQDWAMSPVLFLPETLVYGTLASLGLGVRATLAVNGVLNFLALYGALRIASGSRRVAVAPVVGATLALALFASLALLEGTFGASGLQLASLLGTTTYYSASVIGSIATFGLVRRLADHDRVPPLIVGVLAVVSAISVLSNPLYLAWALAPLVIAAGALALRERAARLPLAVALGALLAGALTGLLGRQGFAHTIVADTGNYLRPSRWMDAAHRYAELWRETGAEATGVLWQLLVVAIFVVAVVIAVRMRMRRARVGSRLLATAGVAAPLLTIAWAVALGTDAERYLQSMVFAPIAACVLLPELFAHRIRAPRVVPALAGSLVVLGGAVAVVPLVTGVGRTDADLACATSWIESSGRTGVGQFWTVRAPKAYSADPARLIQVDAELHEYAWLVNRADAVEARATFAIIDENSLPFRFPPGLSPESATTVDCGRYLILDFGEREIPVGTPHS